jgi:hypothetical protein
MQHSDHGFKVFLWHGYHNAWQILSGHCECLTWLHVDPVFVSPGLGHFDRGWSYLTAAQGRQAFNAVL